jgi:hypothetical protein
MTTKSYTGTLQAYTVVNSGFYDILSEGAQGGGMPGGGGGGGSGWG